MATEEYEISSKVDCLHCTHRRKWTYDIKYVSRYDKCGIARHSAMRYDAEGKFLTSIISHPEFYNVNPLDCKMSSIKEFIKNNRLWVHLYFKGREKEPIIVEKDRHEITVTAGWWVRKFFSTADKFHAWQDKRAGKKQLKIENKRKAQILSQMVKELPRV